MFDSNAHEVKARHPGNHHSNSHPVSTDSTGFSTTEKLLCLLFGVLLILGAVYVFGEMRQTKIAALEHVSTLRGNIFFQDGLHRERASILHRMFADRDVVIKMTVKSGSGAELEGKYETFFNELVASLGTSVTAPSEDECDPEQIGTMSARFQVKNIVLLDRFLHLFLAQYEHKDAISEISYEFPKFKHVVDDSLHTMSMPADGVASDAATD
eukprot:789997_1